MSKPNSGKPIIIKINGEKRSFLKEAQKEGPSDNESNDRRKYDLEKEDHPAIIEAAVSQEAEESFDWILPEQDSTQNALSLYKPVKATKQRKGIRLPALSNVERKNNSALKSIALSALFAILLGTGFGFVMLKLVITDSSKPAAVENKSTQAAKNNSPVMNNSKSTEVAVIKPLTAYMIQGGVYSKIETVKSLSSEAITKGIPAETIEMNGQYYLFLGVSDSLEKAKGLSNKYQNKGIEGIFSKTLTIPEKKLSNLTKSEKDVIENTSAVFPLLANVTSGGAITSAELKTISQYKTKLADINNKEIKNKKLTAAKQEITEAVKQINAYQQKKNIILLEKAQQHLLTFMAVYYSL